MIKLRQRFTVPVMLFLFAKALHIIFVVTWFAALFYIVRLFIYSAETAQKPAGTEREVLLKQFEIMKRRLWLGIGWPSSILTLLFGGLLLYYHIFLFPTPIATWLWIKLGFVVLVFGYHDACHRIYKQQAAGKYKYTSIQLRLWNELATIFLFAIVFAVILREQLSPLYLGLSLLAIAIFMWWSVSALARRRAKN